MLNRCSYRIAVFQFLYRTRDKLVKMNSKGLVAALSEEQRKILIEFRKTIQDVLQPHHDDYFLLRWLRARNFDITKAENMIRESFKLRKKLNADELLSDDFVLPEIFKYHVTSALGFDNDGCLVRYVMLGFLDIKGYSRSLCIWEALRLIMYILETDTKALQEHNKKTGLHEMRAVYIIDVRDFSIRQIYDKQAFNFMAQTLKFYQDNYPETLKSAYVVNAASYIAWIWNMLKPFLDPVTIEKVKIFASSDESWKEMLLSTTPPEIIPGFLGGTRCDPDGNPTCQTLVSWRDKQIPTSYYLKDKYFLHSDDPEVKTVAVRERSHFKHRILIAKPGTRLKWEFQTKDYNINFGVFYEKMKSGKISDNPPDELIPMQNVESNIIPEIGDLLCQKAGKYILCFDNKNSWLTSKNLMYKVTIEEPEETII